MTIHTPELRQIASLTRDIRAFALENGLDPTPLDGLHYRDLLNAVLCARFPAERIRGRWWYSTGDVPRAAAAFGVVPKEAPPATSVTGRGDAASMAAA